MDQKLSRPFCILPWIHMHIMPDSSVIPCCVSPYEDVYGHGQKSSYHELMNSEKYKSLRLDLLKGEAPPGCAHCVHLEKAGLRSMRLEMNHQFRHHFDLAAQTAPDGSIDELPLKYFDVRFSNLCNFKCRGCGPTLSSAWHDDHQVQSVKKQSPLLWETLRAKINEPEIIYFGGGEPLLSPEHFEILNELVRTQRFDVTLKYNTNLSTLTFQKTDLVHIWSQFKNVSISMSLDDLGKRAEYFRHGTRWPAIEKNIKVLCERAPFIERTVNCTVHLFNVFYLPELVRYLLDQHYIAPLNFNVNLLLDPLEYRIDVLPAGLKQKIKNKLLKFRFYLLGQGDDYLKLAHDLDCIINFMEAEDRSSGLHVFKERTLKLDQLRNEDFLSTFPELSELI